MRKRERETEISSSRDQCKIESNGFSPENLCPVADLRIKQEPIAITEKVDKLAERLSEIYPGRGFDASSYGPNSDHLPHGAQLGTAIVAPMAPVHPPTSDQKPARPAMWNAKINKASTVSTVDGGEYHLLSLRHRERSMLLCTWRVAQIMSLIQRRSANARRKA